MKREEFMRLVRSIFATQEREIFCSEFFEQLPRFVDLESSGQDAAALLPQVAHHMHRCPECEEVYQVLQSERAG